MDSVLRLSDVSLEFPCRPCPELQGIKDPQIVEPPITNQQWYVLIWLVVSTPLKNISQLGRIIPYIMGQKKCLKPPTSNDSNVSPETIKWGCKTMASPDDSGRFSFTPVSWRKSGVAGVAHDSNHVFFDRSGVFLNNKHLRNWGGKKLRFSCFRMFC